MKIRKIVYLIAFVLALLTIASALAVSPDLELTDLQVGKTGETFVSYPDGNETSAFQPGEDITLKLTVKNSNSSTIENIAVVETVDPALTGFPDNKNEPNPFFLLASQDGDVTYTYQIPAGLSAGVYTLTFDVSGEDENNNLYASSRSVDLKVEQELNNVYVDSLDFDSDLTCQEKQNNVDTPVKVVLVNNGQEAQTGVKVVLFDNGNELDSKTATINAESGNPGEQSVTFDVATDFTGQKDFTVKVYRAAQYPNKIYDTEVVSMNGENCGLSFDSTSPSGSTVVLNEGGQQLFDVTVNNPGNIVLTYQWTVDGNSVGSNSDSYMYTAPNTSGIEVVKVEVNNELTKEWNAEVTAPHAAEFSVTEILFEDVDRDQTVTTIFKIKNLGTTDSLTGITAELVGVGTKYNALLLDAMPATLTAGQEVEIELQIDVPEDENSGKHNIGTFKLTSNEGTKDSSIYLQPKSYLVISNFKVNGKSSGDFELDGINEIEVKVKNEYSEDLTDVTITVTILDVDGDDLDEESDEFDLDEGDDNTETLEFDLSDEKIDEDSYEVEVTVEGEADDNSDHKIVQTFTVNVERQKHQVIIKEAELSSKLLQCYNKRATLTVEIENIGESDEDDVEIRVRNFDLNLDLKKANLDLDDYSGSDNDYKALFSLDLSGSPAGKYPLKIDVYIDDDLETSETLELELGDCFETSTSESTTVEYGEGLVDELKAKLAQRSLTTGQKTVSGSFRGNDSYTSLLAILVGLLVIASLLAAAVLVVKKK
jgi:hypothetical protein